jgi:muramoyltetrapeptide carboxypeptidase
LHQRANLTTFHGPMAMTDFSGRYGLAPYSTKHFWPLVEAPERAGATVPESFADWGGSAPAKLGVLASIAPGRAEGILTGGNLSTIASLLGTPFEIEVRDRILFLEDVNEEPFRIDRMLAQLRLAGKLGECRGVLLGAFTRCTARPGNPSLDLDEVIEEYLGSLPVPVLAGFPAGHLPDQATLPFGSRVRLDADAGKLELLELPTTP